MVTALRYGTQLYEKCRRLGAGSLCADEALRWPEQR